jgi:chlorobactene glucosyltransferase
MIAVLAYIALGFLLIRMSISLANLLLPVVLRAGKHPPTVQLSILIPARNEAKNLPDLLDKLTQAIRPGTEIIVYDDASEDESPAILESYRKKYPAIRVLKGEGPPPGWLGKNYACHQLAEAARGDFLLFLDADVHPQAGLIGAMTARMEKYRLDLLSLFPTQEMHSAGEIRSVPLMNYILLSLLPLTLTRLSRNPAFSAANGQCMLFRASAYRTYRFHEKLKKEAVEDIRIMKEMKQLRLRTETLLGGQYISCRMYASYQEAKEGFARNIHHYFGNSFFLMALFAFFTTTGPLLSWLAWSWAGLIFYLFGAAFIRFTTAWRSGQDARVLLTRHPLLHWSMLKIMLYSLRATQKRKLRWKGRNILSPDVK